MKTSVRKWYGAAYADDELGAHIDGALTFEGLYEGMKAGRDVYELIGVGDSVIRERVFERLSDALGVDYDVIYNLWRYPERFARPGETTR